MTRPAQASALILALVQVAVATAPCPPDGSAGAPADPHAAHAHVAPEADGNDDPQLAGVCPCGCGESDVRHSGLRLTWAPPGDSALPAKSRASLPIVAILPRLPDAPHPELDPVPI